MAKKKKTTSPKEITTHTHEDATRKNIPSAEMQPIVDDDTRRPIKVAYERRNRDLDPQLIWRGKYPKNPDTGLEDMDLEEDLSVNAPPLYIQERVNPKVLIDDLVARTKANQAGDEEPEQLDLFGDFDGVPDGDAKTEFYQHDANWSNRMILGDSLQVMASLAEREGMRGKVQCIYFDPPYGIKFNSNFQWSTNDRDVKDGKSQHISREPEQVKAFRDTWQDGVHSYFNYIKDRLLSAKDLLSNSGSLFMQIGDENVHRVRVLMDEIFGEENFISQISVQTTSGFKADFLGNMSDFILWYGKDKNHTKVRHPYYRKDFKLGMGNARWLMFEDFSYRGVNASEKRGEIQVNPNSKPYKPDNIISQGRSKEPQPFEYGGKVYDTWHKKSHWKANYPDGMNRLAKAGRIHVAKNSIQYIRFHTDFDLGVHGNMWSDTGTGNFTDDKVYVVQTGSKTVQRCILMATDPGDLVLDPTCGSGTSAFIAEEFGRRWITIDTSRVALALARTRIMGAKYSFYYLADSEDGKKLDAEINLVKIKNEKSNNDVSLGFIYERSTHIMLGQIANNTEIDTIHESFQEKLEPLRNDLNQLLGTSWEEWEVPRSLDPSPAPAAAPNKSKAEKLLAQWWKHRIARQKEIDASIAAKADVEYLYDKPYEDKSKVRVAGPFTVESISPHRMLGVDENGNPFDQLEAEDPATHAEAHDFVELILNNLRKSGVQQDKKVDKITFDSLETIVGNYVMAEGIYHEEDGTRRRAAIHIGPEFGSVGRQDLVDTAREAADLGMDVVIACGFNYDAQSTELSKLGRIPILKARMNADLHMAQDLKPMENANLFVIFGEPDVEVSETEEDGETKLTVKVLGVDIFDPRTGKVRSDDVDGIACWFVDTNYNGEAFFVRHAYFLGANDPYKSLKTTLKAEVDREAWETLNSDTSRPFSKPETGRIAVKIINHLGDEVMKVIGV